MQWTAVVYAVLMIGSSICSVFGNLLLLLVILLNQTLQTDTWVLTLSFCVCDLALGVSTIPFGIHNSLFKVKSYPSKSATCQGSAFLFLALQLASIHSLTWATVDKFTEICFALSYPVIFTAYRAKIILVMVWVYSIVNASLPLFGFGSYAYSETKFLCVPSFKPSSIAFNMLFMVLGIIIPIVLMCSMYGYIVYIARNQVRRGTFVCNEDHCFYVPANNYFKSSIVMVTTTVCLLVCWLPYIVICFYETLTGKESPQPASAVATWLVLFTSALNPWINSMTQTRYRAALRKSLNKIQQMFEYPRKGSLSQCTTIQPRSESNSSSSPAPSVPPAQQTNNQPQQDLTLV
ncbi:adenosine receptor A3 [Danio rerio]|uniref:Adenosine receptor A3 n=1 Tax=Danio rerio TaxID=7955 RepID=A0A8M2B5I8_DANRE|nr:adenosine receptor A3-like [Danio rerio]|eukprot:XP_005158684.3 adenosine receptor A3-like [Danio rerio]